MKKAKFLPILALAAMACPALASAQDAIITEESITVTEIPECDVKYYNSWRDGWFIQLGAGINLTAQEGFKDNKKHIGADYNVAFGRWWSPYFGFRIGGSYSNDIEAMDAGNMHYRSFRGYADVMWDMCNSIGGVNLSRPVSVVPFLGAGAAYNYHFGGYTGALNFTDHGKIERHSCVPVLTAGVQFRFRLCKYVDFFLEGRGICAGDNYNNIDGDLPIDLAFEGTGGFTFNIGGKSFQAYAPCIDQAYMATLNAQVNDLRAELAATAAALAAAESQLPCPEAAPAPVASKSGTAVPMMATVRFTINSAKVAPMEMVNIYNVAEYMKQNPDAKVVVTGYADRDTGTSEYNQTLSERRAQAVYDILVDNYGISPSRLSVQADGSSTQPYPTNDWNRIVIFTQE